LACCATTLSSVLFLIALDAVFLVILLPSDFSAGAISLQSMPLASSLPLTSADATTPLSISASTSTSGFVSLASATFVGSGVVVAVVVVGVVDEGVASADASGTASLVGDVAVVSSVLTSVSASGSSLIFSAVFGVDLSVPTPLDMRSASNASTALSSAKSPLINILNLEKSSSNLVLSFLEAFEA